MATSTNPVPLTRVMRSTAGRKVGYVLFNEHEPRRAGRADHRLPAACATRPSRTWCWTCATTPAASSTSRRRRPRWWPGPAVDGQLFEQLRYNDQARSDESASEHLPFPAAGCSAARSLYAAGTPLPQLTLPRVYVLTSQLTCSASESIVNSLRGIGVQVILVGDRTCGKPYGFYRKDNCGQAYFPIEFQVYNAARASATTRPASRSTAAWPRTRAARWAAPPSRCWRAALTHIDSGACPAGTATPFAASVLRQSDGASMLDRPEAPPADSPMYQPGWNGRRLQP